MIVGKHREYSQWTPDTPYQPFATATEFLLHNQTANTEGIQNFSYFWQPVILFSPLQGQIAANLMAAVLLTK